jgi:hypothetical protein
MKRPLLIAVGASLLSVGCSVDEDNFAAKFARLSCKRTRQCEPDDFDDWYDDMDDCVDDLEGIYDEVQDWAEMLCDIDYQMASRCYRQMKWASCDELDDENWSPEACEEYVVCDGWGDSGWW